MSYVDCFLAPVPLANKSAYEELAKISAKVVKEYGALSVMECWLDELGPNAETYHGAEAKQSHVEYPSFLRAAGTRQGETVVMSYVEWRDKAARNAGMEKVTKDPRMQFGDQEPAFDGSRLIAGGFRPMLGASDATPSIERPSPGFPGDVSHLKP
jgi:uncharacterized protein YbaA (DUF1428 family)